MTITLGPIARPFLTAQWRNLVVINYQVDPSVLLPLVPEGTELDLWQGRALFSMVGFEFVDTRVLGVSVPFHRNFPEVNLRFYVRRRTPDGWRRGVVFLRELVALPAVAWIARLVYGENYLTVPLEHRRDPPGQQELPEYRAEFGWRHAGENFKLELVARGSGRLAEEGSLDEFIIEHYWGYSGRPGRRTTEYRVDHPRWKLWPATEARFVGDARRLYGEPLDEALRGEPVGAFYANGSAVEVARGVRL